MKAPYIKKLLQSGNYSKQRFSFLSFLLQIFKVTEDKNLKWNKVSQKHSDPTHSFLLLVHPFSQLKDLVLLTLKIGAYVRLFSFQSDSLVDVRNLNKNLLFFPKVMSHAGRNPLTSWQMPLCWREHQAMFHVIRFEEWRLNTQ